MLLERVNFVKGLRSEDKIGFSRVIKMGSFIHIERTSSVQPDGNVLYEDDPQNQTKYILSKMEKFLNHVGASKENVMSINIFTKDASLINIFKNVCLNYFEDEEKMNFIIVNSFRFEKQLIEIELKAEIINKNKQ